MNDLEIVSMSLLKEHAGSDCVLYKGRADNKGVKGTLTIDPELNFPFVRASHEDGRHRGDCSIDAGDWLKVDNEYYHIFARE